MAADAASDDGGGLDSETGAALATESLALAPLPLFVGDFPDQEALLRALEQVPVDELAKRVEPFEPGLFPSCQQDVPELASLSKRPPYVGGAFIAGDSCRGTSHWRRRRHRYRSRRPHRLLGSSRHTLT